MHVREYIERYFPEYYSWNEYPAVQTVSFCKTDQEWGIFSNFAPTPIVADGVTFPCAESLFQIMKFTDPTARSDIFKQRGQTLKMCAKHYEKTVGVRPDWGQLLVHALKYCLMLKYEQSPAFRAELERSCGRYIVEDQTTFPKKLADTYGAKLNPDGTLWSGPNLMGRLLMELRDNGHLDYNLPDDIIQFKDLI
jgi:ribA/ribD-fused uncharacterized protein